ncbi:MAG: hypothetical protein AAFV51_11270 [Pseudomonadota bacterium]
MAFRPVRYAVELLSSIAVYGGSLVLANHLYGRLEPDGGLAALIALVPVAATGLTAYVILKHLFTMDELHRKIQFEAFAVSAILTGFGTFAVGFLEAAGLPQPSFIWVFPAMIGGWGLMLPIVTRRYR